MFTPASVVATGSSRAVTSRAQLPGRMRLRAAAKEKFEIGDRTRVGVRRRHQVGVLELDWEIARSQDGRPLIASNRQHRRVLAAPTMTAFLSECRGLASM